MLPASRLAGSIRYALRDMQGAAFSDFEIIEALNRAASLIWGRMGEKFVWAALKRTVLIVDRGEARLPRDFHNVRKVTGEGRELAPAMRRPREGQYRIAGDAFLAPDGAYQMEYWYIPAPVFDMKDSLDAPEAASPYVERAALAFLRGDMEAAELAAQQCCHALAAGELSRFSDTGPVEIWGGKA